MEELKGGVEFADSSKFYSVLSRIDTKTRNLLNDSVFFPRLHFLSFLLFRMTCHFLLCVMWVLFVCFLVCLVIFS